MGLNGQFYVLQNVVNDQDWSLSMCDDKHELLYQSVFVIKILDRKKKMKLEHLLRILDWVPRNDDNEEHNLAAQIEKKKKIEGKHTKHTKHTGQQIHSETQMYVVSLKNDKISRMPH